MKRRIFLFLLLSLVTLCFSQRVKFVSGDFYPPFIYRNERGEVVGISIEMLKAIEKVSELRFDVELLPFSKALSLVESGQADMINLIFKSPERERVFLFSKPILRIRSLVWVRKDLKVKDFKDLSAFVVGVVEGDANEALLRAKNPSILFKRFADFDQLVQAVESGEIEVFLMEDLTASYYLIKHDLYHLFESLPPLSIEWAYFAFTKSKPQLLEQFNAALDRLPRGEIDRIVNLFVKMKFFFPIWLRWLILFGSLATFLFFVVLILINKRLARLVEQRTEELKKKNEELQASYEELDAMNQELRANNEELEAMNQELENINKQLEEKTEQAERFQNAFRDVLDLTNKLTYESLQEKDFLFEILKVFKRYLPNRSFAGVVLRSSQPGMLLTCIASNGQLIVQRISVSYDFSSMQNRAELLKIVGQVCDEKDLTNVEIVPIRSQDVTHGVLLYKAEALSPVEKQYIDKFSNFLATLLSLRSYVREQGLFQRRLLSVVVKALEYYDYYTRGHSANVARYATLFAERLRLDRNSIRRLFWVGMVHDVGKIFVPQHILNKNGFLSLEEYELVKIHPLKSFELLSEAGLEDMALIARHHHERYDGKGYPDGLSGENIPYESRILSIVDAFDAMTTDRPYKKAVGLQGAIAEIERCSGFQFDPYLAKKFVELLKESPEMFVKVGR
ncbi:HD domain-containing phosphohydrolase [Pseudothermotoga sp.]